MKKTLPADEIRRIRVEILHMTQGQLAEAIGVHETTISRAECGKTAPHPTFVRDLQALARRYEQRLRQEAG